MERRRNRTPDGQTAILVPGSAIHPYAPPVPDQKFLVLVSAPPLAVADPDYPSASATSSATSEGFVAALMPASLRASLLAPAVLSPPETMAPAWPIVLPSGAVKPAM